MVNEAEGTVVKTKEGKYHLYIPRRLATDTMFPFELPKREGYSRIHVYLRIEGDKLIVEKLKEGSYKGKKKD